MTRQQMLETVMALPPRQRACLVLSRREKWDNREIGKRLGISESQAREALAAALLELVLADKREPVRYG